MIKDCENNILKSILFFLMEVCKINNVNSFWNILRISFDSVLELIKQIETIVIILYHETLTILRLELTVFKRTLKQLKELKLF